MMRLEQQVPASETKRKSRLKHWAQKSSSTFSEWLTVVAPLSFEEICEENTRKQKHVRRFSLSKKKHQRHVDDSNSTHHSKLFAKIETRLAQSLKENGISIFEDKGVVTVLFRSIRPTSFMTFEPVHPAKLIGIKLSEYMVMPTMRINRDKLKVGMQVIFINEIPVVDLSYTDCMTSLNREVEPGKPLIVCFSEISSSDIYLELDDQSSIIKDKTFRPFRATTSTAAPSPVTSWNKTSPSPVSKTQKISDSQDRTYRAFSISGVQYDAMKYKRVRCNFFELGLGSTEGSLTSMCTQSLGVPTARMGDVLRLAQNSPRRLEGGLLELPHAVTERKAEYPVKEDAIVENLGNVSISNLLEEDPDVNESEMTDYVNQMDNKLEQIIEREKSNDSCSDLEVLSCKGVDVVEDSDDSKSDDSNQHTDTVIEDLASMHMSEQEIQNTIDEALPATNELYATPNIPKHCQPQGFMSNMNLIRMLLSDRVDAETFDLNDDDQLTVLSNNGSTTNRGLSGNEESDWPLWLMEGIKWCDWGSPIVKKRGFKHAVVLTRLAVYVLEIKLFGSGSNEIVDDVGPKSDSNTKSTGNSEVVVPQDNSHDRISHLRVMMRLEPAEIGDILLPYVSFMREDGTEVAQRSQDILFLSKESPKYVWLRMRSNDHRGELLDELDQWYLNMMGNDFQDLGMDQVTEREATNIIKKLGLHNVVEGDIDSN